MSHSLQARRQGKDFLVIGHRGAAGHAPENTMASFLKAVELNTPMIELDIHETRDGVLAVIHDQDVIRTTDGQGPVEDMTWSELQGLDAGGWFRPEFAGERIPRIEQVLEAIGPRALLNIEVKSGRGLYPDIVRKLAALVRAYDLTDRVLISSFHPEYLRQARELLPEAEISIIYAKAHTEAVQEAVREGWHSLHPRWDHVTPELLAEAHEHGLLVRPWNFKGAQRMRPFLEMGVDGVITDFPDVALQLAKEMGRL